MSEFFQGLGVSSGVAVGHAELHEPEALPVVPVPVPPERVDEEIERFERVRDQARTETATRNGGSGAGRSRAAATPSTSAREKAASGTTFSLPPRTPMSRRCSRERASLSRIKGEA